jgi:hypothetical protein
MLIRFTVQNFKTFKERVELSMVASNYDKFRKDENVVELPDSNLKLLKSAVVYGANASGKSKLMEAFIYMRSLALTSSKDTQKGEAIDVDPFRLDTFSEQKPTEFEVTFTYQNEQYRYGFQVTTREVVSEWLYHKPNTKELELFSRDGQAFKIHPKNFSTGKKLQKENFVRENALMLSAAAQWNDVTAGKVLDWFRSLKVISGIEQDAYAGFTISRSNSPEHKQKHIDFLQSADIDIQDISFEKLDIARLPGDLDKNIRESLERRVREAKEDLFSDVLLAHKQYNEKNEHVSNVNFSLNDDESSGTRRVFFLSGPILDAISNGYTLVVDELDSNLHPNLVCKIVNIFNSKELNPNNAQLIFNTHDTNLLDANIFRRDQIWFTEKNRYGEVSLFSLADFKTSHVRKEHNFEKNYISGRYGGVPYLADFNRLFTHGRNPSRMLTPNHSAQKKVKEHGKEE